MKRRMKKCVSAFLALMLLTTLLPAAGFAEDGQRASVSNSAQSPVQLTKSVQTDDKGDSTLSLEAYVTGKVTHSDTPLDIVMVMDQSGSMQGSNLTALKAAANTFMTTIAKDAGDNHVDHRVAVVGYASDEDAGKTGYAGDIINGSHSYWVNTGLYVNGDFKNYVTKDSYQEISRDEMDPSLVYYIKDGSGYTKIYCRDGKWKYYGGLFSGWVEIDKNETVYSTKLSAADYQASLVSAGNSGTVNSVVSQTIDKLAASGATYTEYGMLMAGKVFENGCQYTDLMLVSPKDAKRDERLKNSGKLTMFRFSGQNFPLIPESLFYNYIYINAIIENEKLAKKILDFNGFTDIEFNPQKSISTQAESAAIYVALAELGMTGKIKDYKDFYSLFIK